MSRAKKRKRANDDASECDNSFSTAPETSIGRDLFVHYYGSSITLRDYLLASLPRSSRHRRKRIAKVCSTPGHGELERQLASLLDSAIVCTPKTPTPRDEVRWAQWTAFSSAQRHDDSRVTISNDLSDCHFSQSEIIDFIIWLLFRREKPGSRPKHLLCDGFRKSQGEDGQGIEGPFNLYPNSQVKLLKETPWPQLLKLLGQSGERIMIDLLLDCSIFIPVHAGFQNYYQLSGIPISELDSLAKRSNHASRNVARPLSDITLVRSRIFYAKPAMSARGTVRSGFKHIHILNRYPRAFTTGDTPEKIQSPLSTDINTIKVMMYVFPRQFGLHNVFTSQVDRTKTAQKFQDYTMREDEIGRLFATNGPKAMLPRIPKRLRGETVRLVERLRILHARCSYLELLDHYCPITLACINRHENRLATQSLAMRQGVTSRAASRRAPNMKRSSQARSCTIDHRHGDAAQELSTCHHESITELSTPVSSVSAFCRMTLRKLIPHEFWGNADVQSHNLDVLSCKVDHFVRLRRFETMSLHEITQDFKISGIPWLQHATTSSRKPCKTETTKRMELFLEFLYFVFDSLLMPLIRSNFYVTESNIDRNQIFYFRHRVWRHVAEPALLGLKLNMLEEVKFADATALLRSRRLGYSQIRLLPKGAKLRPIMNLRRRMLRIGVSKNLGPSINSVLSPVHSMLKFETEEHPHRLGAAMFSIGELHSRLKDFRASLKDSSQPLYFVKLDVRAAFDTIPQAAAVELMRTVPTLRRYAIAKHAEVKPGERLCFNQSDSAAKPIRRWHSTATSATDESSFLTRVEEKLGSKRKSTVFVDSAGRVTHEAQSLYNLLNEHVSNNIVKVGKKFYRQRKGIPQGSVLSSFLCNYFYADLESEVLGFLRTPGCLLLRLIDDFLLITLDRTKAERFLEVMHSGVPAYGVKVSPEKTMVNFDVCSSQGAFRRVAADSLFPYCGTLIDCRSLELRKDRGRDSSLNIANSLTVEYGRTQGYSFQRKVLGFFKLQSHLMFYDSTHNSTASIHESIRGAFRETARKMWAYVRCLPTKMQPSSGLVNSTIAKLINVAFVLLTSKSRKLRDESYVCNVRKSQLSRIAHGAFLEVLAQKQARFAETISWLRIGLQKAESMR